MSLSRSELLSYFGFNPSTYSKDQIDFLFSILCKQALLFRQLFTHSHSDPLASRYDLSAQQKEALLQKLYCDLCLNLPFILYYFQCIFHPLAIQPTHSIEIQKQIDDRNRIIQNSFLLNILSGEQQKTEEDDSTFTSECLRKILSQTPSWSNCHRFRPPFRQPF